MAQAQTLRELAQLLRVDLADLLITCFYCTRWLTYVDKVLFLHSGLGLHYRDDLPYAACQPCVKATARLDFLLNYQGFMSVDQICGIKNKDFSELDVRCWSCLRVLNRLEKLDVATTRGDVALIGDQVRARCLLCKIGIA
uniref:Protein E6 n=1 Tax=Barbastella barbastellus papillomavirus 1 TaxID=3139985 RepID=A0AAU6S4W0_9PAPI